MKNKAVYIKESILSIVRRKGGRCTVARILETLDQQHKTEVLRAIAILCDDDHALSLHVAPTGKGYEVREAL